MKSKQGIGQKPSLEGLRSSRPCGFFTFAIDIARSNRKIGRLFRPSSLPTDDAVIIGTDATGGTAAKVLSEPGLKVVGLDRGPWLTPKDFSGDEIKHVNRNFLVPDPLPNPRTFRESEANEAKLAAFSLLPQMPMVAAV